MRILLVEDVEDIVASISEYLELQGHICDYAYNGSAGLQQAINNEYDVYIFDIAMPGMNGLTLCKTLRLQKNDTTPALFLTARDTLEDKLEGFACGADDYLVKPFELKELNARIEAIFRRYRGSDEKILSLDNLEVNIDKQEVKRGGQKLELSPISFKLLAILMQSYPRVVSREQIEYELWGDELPDSDSLRSHIYRLRRIIDKPFPKKLIQTVQSRGFRMVDK